MGCVIFLWCLHCWKSGAHFALVVLLALVGWYWLGVTGSKANYGSANYSHWGDITDFHRNMYSFTHSFTHSSN